MSSEFFVFAERGLTFSALTNTTLNEAAAARAWQTLVVGLIHTFVALPPAHAPPPYPSRPTMALAMQAPVRIRLGSAASSSNGTAHN